MKKFLSFAIAAIICLGMASCSKKESTASEPSYNLVGTWSLTDAKASFVDGSLSLNANSVILKEDKTGEISYKNLFQTEETAKFAWTIEGNQLVLTDPENELKGLFVGLTVPAPLKLDIKNYTDAGFDIASTFTAQQDGKDLVITLTGHFTRK